MLLSIAGNSRFYELPQQKKKILFFCSFLMSVVSVCPLVRKITQTVLNG